MKQRSYFAFVSYSRRDSIIANSIHKRLEGFRYPSKVKAEFRPGNRHYVREVFIDKRCLACTHESFRVNLREALKNSRYLIVVCSRNAAKPNAAGEHFVNDEIKCFLDAHEHDLTRVLPVIVEGGVENLPPALKIPEFIGPNSRNIPVLGNEEGAKDEFMAQILSYLLRVDLQLIRSRMNSQRVRFWRKCVVAGVFLAAVFMAMSFGMFVLKREADANRVVAQKRAVKIERQAREVNRQRMLAERNAERAERQREIADGALDFMMDTFAQGDPAHSGRYDVKVSEALENRQGEIDKLEPWELRAFVSARVGSLLDNVGSYESASNLLFSAYSLNKTHRPDAEETAYSLYQLSWWYAHQRKYKAALGCSLDAVRIYEKAGLTNSLALAQTYNAAGMSSLFMGKAARVNAERYLLQAQELRERVLSPMHPGVAIGLKNLGFLYRAQRDSNKALQCFERARTILAESKLENDTMAQVLLGLAFVYRDNADYEEALLKFNEALEIRIATSGSDSRGTLNVFKEIGNTQRSNGQYEEATKAYEDALRISLKVLGENDPTTIDLQRCLAVTKRLLVDSGRSR